MSDLYTVEFSNNSSTVSDFTVFQRDPDLMRSGADEFYALAWFAYPVEPGGVISFDFEQEYEFVWGVPGRMSQTSHFVAEIKPIPVSEIGKGVKLVNTTKMPVFEPMHVETKSDQFEIYVDNVHTHECAIGINTKILGNPPGSGPATFVTNADDNITYQFTANPTYWVTRDKYKPGQAINFEKLSEMQELDFSGTTKKRTVTVDAAGKLTVT